MNKLTAYEKSALHFVDTGTSRIALEEDLRGLYAGESLQQISMKIDELVERGILTESVNHPVYGDWIVVTEWMPNIAREMRLGLYLQKEWPPIS